MVSLKVRKGPLTLRDSTVDEGLKKKPVVRKYFDALKAGDVKATLDCYESDGYFREPANNHECGLDLLEHHYKMILGRGGIDIEFLSGTATHDTLGLEIQTVGWFDKRYDVPQAGFAVYEIGRNGLIQAARVYDSVVPPQF